MSMPILTVSHHGTYDANFIASLHATVAGGRGDWINSMADSSIVRHRSKLICAALKASIAPHFLWIDSDIGWKQTDIDRIESHPAELEIVSGVYVKKMDPPEPVFRQDGDAGVEYPGNRDIISASRVPMGFLRVSRAAMEDAVRDGEKTRAGWSVAFPEGIINGVWETEDYMFCARQKLLGRTSWLDRAIRLSHRGSKEYRA